MTGSPRPTRRVLVLGAGFIGAHVVHRLLRDGREVEVISRSAPEPTLAPLLEGARLVVADVSSMSAVAGRLTDTDHVVYAVGSASPVESDLDPSADLSIVVPPVVRLLELLRLRPGVGMTFVSSGGAVYGNAPRTPVDETLEPRPISSYGILKMTIEKYLDMYAERDGMDIRVLRVANAYGPGQPWVKGQGIVARLMRSAVTGEVFPVYGDGHNVRDYVYVGDVAHVVSGLVDRPGPRVLNVGSGTGHSILELVGLVEAVSGARIELAFHAARDFDVREIVLDVGLLRSTLPFAPVELAAGLDRTWRALDGLGVLADLPPILLHSPTSNPGP